MSEPAPFPNETLGRIRRAIRSLQGDHPVLPHRGLIDLMRDGTLGDGLTVDFGAAAELGCPLVVVRPSRRGPPACLDRLSQREREVAALVAAGLRNRQIADRLCISLATVKDHVHNILEKTGLSGRAALIAVFHQG